MTWCVWWYNDNLCLIVDLCDEKIEVCFVLSDNEFVDLDLIGDGGDYNIRLEYQRIKFNIFEKQKNHLHDYCYK